MVGLSGCDCDGRIVSDSLSQNLVSFRLHQAEYSVWQVLLELGS